VRSRRTIAKVLDAEHPFRSAAPAEPRLVTPLGALYQVDCVELLETLADGVADTVFADPPFNLGKQYGARVDDRVAEDRYLAWCERWLGECVRVLRPGGALFVYNLPRWNMLLGAHLMASGMTFRHWIAVSMKASLPIARKLYPAHYSLLYFTKGKPRTFRSVRTPIQLCRHCGKEIKDYGGHRAAMNPRGVNLTDVWDDIAPVRHRKFKSEHRKANQLSTRLLVRVVEMSTCPGDLVIDPFGGSGTTFDVCELLGRRWIGSELEDCTAIVHRLEGGSVARHEDRDWVDADGAAPDD
jgi:site-specific DNA-methyltransferase (adenine-specific)